MCALSLDTVVRNDSVSPASRRLGSREPRAGLPQPRLITIALVVLGGIVALYGVELALPIPYTENVRTFEKVCCNVIVFCSAIVCGLRGILRREERAAWLLFALGLLLWASGNVYYTFFLWDLKQTPFPSPADFGYLAFYGPIYVGLMLLVGKRTRGSDSRLWLDGIISALAVAAIGSTVAFDAVLATTGGSPAAVATNLAYPLADLILCALVLAVVGMSGWDLFSTWGWIAVALIVFAVADTLYLHGTAMGTYEDGAVFDVGWPLTAWLLAVAAWRPARVVVVRRDQGWKAITVPIGFAALALTMLVYDHFSRINLLALGLSTAAMLTVLVRLVLAFKDNLHMLRQSQREATTDAITGLGNRRRLLLDLSGAGPDADPAEAAQPRVVALYDLDGFKHFNDSFGHLAGDALLARLGAELARNVRGRGDAYRMGGDEFCAVWPLQPGDDPDRLARDGALALSEEGDGFSITCSYGFVVLPLEAGSPEDALRSADQRMYSHKRSRPRPNARREALLGGVPNLRSSPSEV